MASEEMQRPLTLSLALTVTLTLALALTLTLALRQAKLRAQWGLMPGVQQG